MCRHAAWPRPLRGTRPRMAAALGLRECLVADDDEGAVLVGKLIAAHRAGFFDHRRPDLALAGFLVDRRQQPQGRLSRREIRGESLDLLTHRRRVLDLEADMV